MTAPSERDRETARTLAARWIGVADVPEYPRIRVARGDNEVPIVFSYDRDATKKLCARLRSALTPLIAAALSAAREEGWREERERCRNVAEDYAVRIGVLRSMEATYKAEYAREIAEAIRRGP